MVLCNKKKFTYYYKYIHTKEKHTQKMRQNKTRCDFGNSLGKYTRTTAAGRTLWIVLEPLDHVVHVTTVAALVTPSI